MLVASAILACGLAARAQAQDVSLPVPVIQSAPAAPVCENCVVIPALTQIEIEVLTAVGSKISKSGDMFPIRLAAPILVDGKVIVPAGVTGMGEVIHAKKAGGSGAPGELVLAARYLDLDGKRLRLRSMNVSQSGKSRYRTADTMAIATAAAAPILSLFVFAVKGGETVVNPGDIADAKTAEMIAILPGSIVAPPPELAPAAATPLPPAAPEKGK